MAQHRENIFACGKFDVTALLQIARDIRQVPCWCDEGRRPTGGSFNWVIFVFFEDGVEWVFRSPRLSDFYGLKQDVVSELLASEVATLKYLRENSDVPVPEVFSSCPNGQNDIGVPYILMSKAPGMSLSTFAWKEDMTNDPRVAYNSRDVLTLAQKQKVMKQLGRICASLSNLRFNQLGSLFLHDKGYVIGKSLYPGLTWQGRDLFGDDEIPRGPFDDARGFYSALVSAFFAQVTDLAMHHHLFHAPVPVPTEYEDYNGYYAATDRWNDYVAVGSKIDSDKSRLEYALVGTALKDVAPLLAERDNQFKCSGFALCHPDLSTGNIFVDEELNITCIIDWSFASSLPLSMFFVCPGLPHARDGTQPHLFPSFAKGFLRGRGFDGQTDLDYSNSSIFWNFARLVNFDAVQDYHYFSDLLHALTGQDVYPFLHGLKDRAEVVHTAQCLSELEPDVAKEAEREAQYFSYNGPERHALARHLTVVAELNPCFAADRRLWKRMARYLEDRQSYMFPGQEIPAHSWNCSLVFGRSLLRQLWGCVCPRFSKGIQGF